MLDTVRSEDAALGAAPQDQDGGTSPEPGVAGNGRSAPILSSLREHRRAIATTTFVTLLATVAAYALIPRRYTAEVDVWLDHGLDRPGVAAGKGDTLARNTEIRVLTSNDLAARTVDRLGLGDVAGIGQPRTGPRLAPGDARRAAIAAVRDGMRVTATGTSYAVRVGFAAFEPTLAAGIANRLADLYVEDRRIGGTRGREQLAMQAEAARARDLLVRQEAAVSGYRAATEIARQPQDLAVVDAEASILARERGSAEDAQRIAEATLRAATGADAGTADRPTSIRLRELQARREQLAATGDDPAAMALVDRDIAGEGRRIAGLIAGVSAARDHAGLIRAAATRVAGELQTRRNASVELDRLERQARDTRARYAAAFGRYRQRIAAVRADTRTAYVISHARAQSARTFPNIPTFAAIGLLIALLAGAIVVAVLEWVQKGFRTRQGLERRIGLPVIGLVPDLGRTPGVDLAADDPMAAPDYLYNNGRSAFSAAFRSIHTGLRLGGTSHSPRVLAICSALPEEGKTTVSICLARSAAMAGLRVVLVDCDARRPAASRALIPHVRTGLAEVLEDGVPFRDGLHLDTPSGASFLPQTSDRPLTNGIVSSAAMATLLDQLKREFDLVILDTPPALALVEAREVAALADAALLVARYRKTPADAVAIAHDLLTRAGVNVSATALTMIRA